MMDSRFSQRLFSSESELKLDTASYIPLAISSIVLLLVLVILKHAWEYFWIGVYLPRKAAQYMRRQGYSGPPMDWTGNTNTEEVQGLLEKAASEWQNLSNISHDIEPRALPMHAALKKRYGENYVFYRFRRVWVSRSDPLSMKEIFSGKSNNYKQIRGPSTILEIIGHKGLLAAEGAEWSRQRRLVRPAFYAGRAKDMVPLMATSIESWLQNLESRLDHEKSDTVEIDMAVPVGNLTRSILAKTSFESNFEKGREGFDTVEPLLRLLFRRATSFYQLIRWLPTPLEKEIRRLKSQYIRCLREIVQERRQSVQSTSSESYGGSLLDLLLADQAKSMRDGSFLGGDWQRRWTDEDDEKIVDQFRTFFFAGSDTAQSAILWSIVMLAHHSDWQKRLRSEGKEALESSSLNGETLSKLPQLDMFVNEVLRLYTPAVNLFREVAEDHTTWRGEKLPKSLGVHVNLLKLHTRKETWGEDALEFNPMRFSQGISKACKNTPFAYMPFGAGPRICVAQSFVLIEIKLVLLMFLQRFSFRLSPAYRHEPIIKVVLYPGFGVPLIMERLLKG